MSVHPTDSETAPAADFDWWFVGGTEVDGPGGIQRVGQMYVERYRPTEVRHPWPVVMWHGGVQTGTNFTATPDGRRGWLHDFLRAGYTVLVLDQPERGRSGHALCVVERHGLMRYDRARIEQRFTAPALSRLWPQAATHTQWPGPGVAGDPIFENFFASQVEMLADRNEIERLNHEAGIALLDRIGPAVLLTHSQSGPFGWLVADARPDLVKAILAIEPSGPPFRDIVFEGAPRWYRYHEALERPYGITRLPLTFEPAMSSAGELDPRLDTDAGPRPSAGDGDPNLVAGDLPRGTARTLPRLAGIPILIATAEASYHAAYDHLTSRFLARAGVGHDFVRLADRGIRGNGHMVMLERNNHEIADLLIEWLIRRNGEFC